MVLYPRDAPRGGVDVGVGMLTASASHLVRSRAGAFRVGVGAEAGVGVGARIWIRFRARIRLRNHVTSRIVQMSTIVGACADAMAMVIVVIIE